MATYQINWKRSALRELKRLDKQVVPTIVATVESLADNPYPTGVRKLQGSQHTYRIRVGVYRIIYEIFSTHLEIEVVRVKHRKDVYR